MTTKKHYATVTFPDGAISSRQTTHNYTHCVAVFDGGGWRESGMHNSLKNAQTRYNYFMKFRKADRVVILPVEISEKKPNPQTLAVKVQRIDEEITSNRVALLNENLKRCPEIYQHIRLRKYSLDWQIHKAVNSK